MRRLISALQEWMQLRARLRDERRFHLDCSEAEFRSFGFTPREAKRAACGRFGRKSFRLAARELGSDLAGLARLIGENRVLDSAWLQPAVLLSVIGLILLLSPEPRQILNSVPIRLHKVDTQRMILLTVDEKGSWVPGSITGVDFEALQSMTTLTQVGRYHGSYAWGQAVPGVKLSTILSEARHKTGNANLAAELMDPRWEVLANPPQIAWLAMAGFGIFLLVRYGFQVGASRRFLWRWLLYGATIGALHATASLAVWAFITQIRNQTGITAGPGVVVTFLFVVYVSIAVAQGCYWWSDLRDRCPMCFGRMVLPLTEGAVESMIFTPAVTETVCANGHGVLVESRWTRQFRCEVSPLEGIVAS